MTSTPPPTGASLSSLPRELVRKICDYAKEQDSAFWEMRFIRHQPEKWDVARKVANDRYGRSLNSLFMLNREFSMVAAALLFDTITFRGSSNFSLRPVSRHSAYFKKLHLHAAEITSIDLAKFEAVMDAAHLLSLDHLEMDRSFAGFIETLEKEKEAYLSFVQLAGRMSTFTAVEIPVEDLLSLLGLCSDLTSLIITGEEENTEALDFSPNHALVTTLQQLSHLKHLALIARRPSAHFCAPTFPSTTDIPTITSLEISTPWIDEVDWSFVLAFSKLQRLVIVAEGAESSALLSATLFESRLSTLSDLSVSAPCDKAFTQILPAFAGIPLRHLHLCLLHGDQNEIPITVFDPFLPTLTTFSVRQEEPVARGTKNLEGLEPVAAAVSKASESERLVTQSQSIAQGLRWDNYEIQKQRGGDGWDWAAFRQARDFTIAAMAEAERVQDQGEAEKILEVLQGFWGKYNLYRT